MYVFAVKTAVILESPVIVALVEEANWFSKVALPSQPAKEYPLYGVAIRETIDPCDCDEFSSFIVPPVPAITWTVLMSGWKFAVMLRSSVIVRLIEELLDSEIPFQVHFSK